MIYQKYIKRVLDVTLSATAIIVLSPVMGVTALLVRKKLGSPVIFKQKRPGKDEKIFTMYKFRTMTDERDCDGNLMPDSVRLTQFGKTLRSTSLDELPE
ncbi:MAG: sugar transferase, partial [Eubacterium sp.]